MRHNQDEARFKFKNFRNQYFAVFSANLLAFSHGANLGWVTPALVLLGSAETPLSGGPITLEQMSWIGSMHSAGAVFGTFTSGYAAGWLGCKRTMAFLAIPAICYWVIIRYATTVEYIIFARFLAGWTGGGVQSITVLYVAEIAEDRIRGRLGSIAQVCRNGGMLSVLILGAYLDYHVLPYIFVAVPIVYLIKFILLPNTPQHLVRRDKFEKAERSLIFYKGCSSESVAESEAISRELERLKTLSIERRANKKWRWSDICEHNALKGLMIGVILSCLHNATGISILLTYAGYILSKSEAGNRSNEEIYTFTIILGAFQLAGPLCTTHLADKLGRKKTMIVSLLGSAIGQMVLAVFALLHKLEYNLTAFNWIPVTSMSFVIFIGALGVIPLSTLCALEILPRKIRTLGMTITTITLNVIAFVTGKVFPIWCEIIRLHGCLALMAGVCALGILFVIFVMDETRGLDLDTIGVRRPAIVSPVPVDGDSSDSE